MAPSKKRRTSAAEVQRLQKEYAERSAQPIVIPDDMRAYIENYRPKSVADRKHVSVLRPFMLDVLSRSNVRGLKSVKMHCTHLMELAVYALKRGLPLTVEAVLTTDLIEEYMRVEMVGSDETKKARRMRLLNLARTVNPGPTTPANQAPIAYSAIRPCYTPDEMTVLRRLVRHQRTARLSRDLRTLVALGAGAGVSPNDLRPMYVRHIDDRGVDTGIWVSMTGKRPRVVPVRLAYEDLLRGAIAGRNPNELVIGKSRERHNLTSVVFERAYLHEGPALDQGRLRATWLADLMTDPIPLALILRSAGLQSSRSLVDLLPHLGPWLEHKDIDVDSYPLSGGDVR